MMRACGRMGGRGAGGILDVVDIVGLQLTGTVRGP